MMRSAAMTFLCSLVLFGPVSCGFPNEGSFLPDPMWVELGETMPLGAELNPEESGDVTRRRMTALGLAPSESGNGYTFKARLLQREEMVPAGTEMFGNIDAIAIISIDRNNGQEPYIYHTLQSLLSEAPSGTQVNIFLGSPRADYVSYPVLAEKIGATFAGQVHVFPVPEETWNFLTEHHPALINKMTWNYARVMRSYTGQNNLLLLEDDVAWSKNIMAHFDQPIRRSVADMISVYNHMCSRLPGSSMDYSNNVTLLQFPISWYAKRKRFSCTQAMVYPARTCAQAGDYLALRLGQMPSDLLLDEFMRRREQHIAFTQPSMVQHMGVQSTGLGYHHMSGCYTPIMPPIEATADAAE